MTLDLAAAERTIQTLTSRLLACRTPDGHWEGRLAGSALSTAVAAIALIEDERSSGRDHGDVVARGFGWLTAHQNSDGGWGDTTGSFSNLSTTALCWAALGTVPRFRSAGAGDAIDRAERWLRDRIGELSAAALERAILDRYGADRTFSVPILTVLALAGKLGSGAEAWRRVPQLPFELAACPHAWFRWMRLPVVSYALPALVAIGHVRHHHAPTRNPLVAMMRSNLRPRTLHVARSMQPESGGYLEAIPLTAFVVMSLIAAGAANDALVERGVGFLRASARDDGSWPIDTNLATWVTTLAVAALTRRDVLAKEERRRIVEWLLQQQTSQAHPFTRAKGGGWAWTDLSGGVPDADDTAGALVALRSLRSVDTADEAVVAGIYWLLELQNRDGGIPTFCRGWGTLPFDRSAPDLTAHALEAWDAWYTVMPHDVQRRIARAATRACAYLMREQRPDGSWIPLWFGNQHAAGDLNPAFGTSRVLGALAAPLARRASVVDRSQQQGLAWLLDAQNDDGGWGGTRHLPSSIEETGMALSAIASSTPPDERIIAAMCRGAHWLIEATDEGQRTPAAPIGLYFASLWYYEELYPLVLGLRGLSQAHQRIAEGRGTSKDAFAS